MPVVSVILPVYNHANYIRFAIGSLLRQSYTKWELIIIDDGSTDALKDVITDYLSDKRISFYQNNENKGLGYCLNRGIKLSHASLISYLPADDIYFENHLKSMVDKLISSNADMVYSGIVYHIGDRGGENCIQQAEGVIPNQTLQLVQVMHRKTTDFWVERKSFVTDDLDCMFWDEYRKKHPKISQTKQITCEWFSHKYQRHHIMNDRNGGGIYMYKTYYGVKEPIRYQSSVGNLVDEITHYTPFKRDSKEIVSSKPNGLKILIVGELAFNPERILALEEKGHKLYGLWIKNPANYNTIGPLPFGHVEEVAFEDWEKSIDRIKPDVIYALLNYKAIELAHYILKKKKRIPFVWHFKEGPFFCRTYGLWDKLIELYEESDGVIYTNQLMKRWFSMFLHKQSTHSMILDGDLPYRYWFSFNRKQKLSLIDGEMHTVVAGRLFGLGSEDVEELAKQHIHLHVYGDIYQNAARRILDEAVALCPGYVHLHPSCPTEKWVSEFSQYDAGWLHYYQSNNYGDLYRANWADLNSPARMATYAMAGLPMIMHNNNGHIVHHQNYLSGLGMDLPIATFKELGVILKNDSLMSQKYENVWQNRKKFCFDTYVDELIQLFESVK